MSPGGQTRGSGGVVGVRQRPSRMLLGAQHWPRGSMIWPIEHAALGD
jgi:hypothetical protein